MSDQHRTLIDAVMVALVNVERKGISLPPIHTADQIMDMDRPYVEEEATAAIAAVLEALREPTGDMKTQGVNSLKPDTSYVDQPMARNCWQAMLSASALTASPIVGEE